MRSEVAFATSSRGSTMPEDWRGAPLGGVLTLQRGFDLPSQDRLPGEVAVVSSSGISGTHSEAKVSGPGVVVGRFGTLGTVTYITDDFWPLNTTLYVRDFKGNDPRFVSFLLQTLDYEAHNDKTTVPGVNRNHLHQTLVRVPPVSEQREVADALDAIESKISVEARLARQLRALVIALFERRFPQLDDETSGAWPIVSLTSIATFARGVSYRSDELRPADRALVTLKCFGRDGMYQTDGLKPFAGPYKASQEVRPGDLVVAQTDITQAGDVIGRVVQIPAHRDYPTLVASLDAVVVRPATAIPNEFLFGVLARESFRDLARGYANGSTVLHLDGRLFTDYALQLPPSELLSRFADEARPLLARAADACQQIDAMDALRRLLLPSLATGTLRLSGAAGADPGS